MPDYLDPMDTLNQSLSVGGEEAGTRIDAFLAGTVPQFSRSQWKTFIVDGRVRVNGAACKPNHRLRAGETVSWNLPPQIPYRAVPEEIPLNILHEDASILVLNKPPGRVVHPAVGNPSGTLLHGLLFHDPVFATLERAGIVHRLDRDTSGVMVVAKNTAAQEELRRQFKARETLKSYLALVRGTPPPTRRIETPMGRHPVHRKKRAVLREGGKPAVTEFRVVEQFKQAALVRVRIETGRTHQIRVHMAYAGHPVLGDKMYGRKNGRNLPDGIDRQMLHAAELGITHPQSGKKLSFEAPLPDDMQCVLKALRHLE
jgi:23S rRNA pseudouridine1911/1915/1917 synthase